MRKNPNKLLIMLPVIAFLVINPARAQHYMCINQNDGTTLEIAVADIQKLSFDISTAVKSHPEVVKQLLKLKAYPNPAKEQVMIDYFLNETGLVIIEIFTLQGLLIDRISQGQQQSGQYHYPINTKHFKPGAYFIRVQQNNESVTQKLIVKH